ncbi:hypothetical protein N7474_006497 [Penicillium riverlandense]|uniref:uncharacterized protein n=1 Tax=Penicillium riverlandense TaxID=1903569 RepID=UPI002548CE4B|nr:uncharacterized protein N7474_006497 [Penicillium riverlandense]KAJ5814720.1 hypothetical protein N7474_006497 [Penicillium riverlandense]
MMRPKPSSSLQKTYDECYLSCSTAVYFEGQNNEEEALRSWRAALETIYHHNARRVSTTYTPKSETEKALQDSIRKLEIQCRERVDLLGALRESRKEAPNNNSNKESGSAQLKKSTVSPSPSFSNHNNPGWIGDGTIPAVGYTDLSKPAAIPGHPWPKQPTPDEDTPPPTAMPSGSSPALRMNSNSSGKSKSRGSSPERRMLTTLRSGDGKKSAKKTPRRKETRQAASKAAGLAWGHIYRPASSEKTVSDAALASSRRSAAQSPSFRREADPKYSSADELSHSSHKTVPVASATDRIPAANWREPRSSPGLTSSPRRQPVQSSPRRPQVQSSARRPPPPPPPHASSLSMPNPDDFTPPNSSAGPPRPSVKPKPVGLRTSLPPPGAVAQTSRSESNSRPLTPRLDREANLSSSQPRTKSAPRSANVGQSAHPSHSSGSGDDLRRGVERMTVSTGNGNGVPRRKPPPIKRRETPSSSDQDSWAKRSSESEAEDGEDEDENNDITKIVQKLPKGVDLPSARQILNDIVVRGDEVHWDDIAGLEGAKKALKEAVVYPFLRPDLFSGLREPARGMLLFGPPGTGKTMLARAVATESKSTFFSVSSSTLTSKWHGESEKLVRALFGLAKVLAPSIIFVDEIDSLLSARSSGSEHEASRRSKTEFLIQWSDLQRAAAGREQSAREKKEGDASRVLVLAATNMPWDIDEAARRRFVRRQYIPLPEQHVREQQLRKLLGHQHQELSDDDIQVLVQVTDGFSGSDITALAKDAAMGPLRNLGEALLHTPMDQIRPIKFQDFEASLYSIRPSVSPDGLRRYEEWAREFGERGG